MKLFTVTEDDLVSHEGYGSSIEGVFTSKELAVAYIEKRWPNAKPTKFPDNYRRDARNDGYEISIGEIDLIDNLDQIVPLLQKQGWLPK